MKPQANKRGEAQEKATKCEVPYICMYVNGTGRQIRITYTRARIQGLYKSSAKQILLSINELKHSMIMVHMAAKVLGAHTRGHMAMYPDPRRN